MEPVATDTIKVQGNLEGQKVLMGFDENSIEHIMSVLTDLYSDPELAVIREYSTNAWDSHVEAGISRPIEVSTPGSLSPYFRVKDFGVGLSVDDITDIYSKYGASTKRNSNDQVGMLGLGCKSALTYSPQFNIISVRNGVKVHVSVSRIESGRPVMEIVDTVSTNDPNGVEIVIPVKNYNQIEQKAKEFFKYWPAGSVLLNGKEPERFAGEEVTNDIYMCPGSGESRIVMGNVSYPCKEALSSIYSYNFHVVAFVPIGSIQFTPSREELHYTSLTKSTINDLRTKFDKNLEGKVRSEIEDSASHAEALKTYYKWVRYLGNAWTPDRFAYKGEKLPRAFEGKFTVYTPNRYRYTTSTERYLNWQSMVSAVVIHGYTLAQLSASHKAKMKQWSEDNNADPERYILCDQLPGKPWTDGSTTVSWDDIVATKLPRAPRAVATGPKAPRQKYEVIGSNGYRHSTDKVDVSKDVIYYSPADVEDWSGSALTNTFQNATLVVIGKNRWDKFKRDFPKAKHLKECLVEAMDGAFKALTDHDKFLITTGEKWQIQHLKKLDHTKIDDPELKQLVLDVGGPTASSTLERYRNTAKLIKQDTKYVIAIPQVQDKAKDYSNLLGRYPLMDRGLNHKEHIYIYINAVYAKKKGV